MLNTGTKCKPVFSEFIPYKDMVENKGSRDELPIPAAKCIDCAHYIKCKIKQNNLWRVDTVCLVCVRRWEFV